MIAEPHLVLEALLEAGFEGLEASRAGRLLVDFATGFVQEESDTAVQLAPRDDEGGAPDVAGRADGTAFPTFPAGAYPSIARLAPYLMDGDGDARFQFGRTVVLDGLEGQRTTHAAT